MVSGFGLVAGGVVLGLVVRHGVLGALTFVVLIGFAVAAFVQAGRARRL